MERKLENTTDSPMTFLIAFGTMLALSFGLMLYAGPERTQVASETTGSIDAPVVEKIEPEK